MSQIDSSTEATSAFTPANRMSAIGVSKIMQISKLASELKRQGRDIVNLGMGEPDFDTPEHIKTAAEQAMRSGATKYTALDGVPELKEAIQEKFRRDNALDYCVDEIIVSAGAKQVIFNAIMATVAVGEEVIIPAPYWTSYLDIVSITGGKPIVIPCSADEGFLLSAAALEAAITERTRWIILNSPCNPTGAAYSRENYQSLLEVMERNPHVWILADDIYEHIVFDDFEFVSPAMVDTFNLEIRDVNKDLSI